jgi:hypothetical protein
MFYHLWCSSITLFGLFGKIFVFDNAFLVFWWSIFKYHFLVGFVDVGIFDRPFSLTTCTFKLASTFKTFKFQTLVCIQVDTCVCTWYFQTCLCGPVQSKYVIGKYQVHIKQKKRFEKIVLVLYCRI